MSDFYVAHWSRGDRKRLFITDQAGREVGSFAVPPGDNRPSLRAFCGAAWAPFPGSEWEEEPPGHWSVSVFRDGPLELGGGRGDMSMLRGSWKHGTANRRQPEYGWQW